MLKLFFLLFFVPVFGGSTWLKRIWNEASTAARTGNYEESIRLYANLVNFMPNLEQAHKSIAAVKSEMPNGSEEALTAYRSLIDLFPHSPSSHKVFCRWFVTKMLTSKRTNDDKNEAFQICRTAVKLAPDDADAWLEYGTLISLLDNMTNARTAISKALSLAPDSVEIIRHLIQICTAEGSWKVAEEKAQALLLKFPTEGRQSLMLVWILFRNGPEVVDLAQQIIQDELDIMIRSKICQGRWTLESNVTRSEDFTTTLLNPETAYQPYANTKPHRFVHEGIPQSFPHEFVERGVYLTKSKDVYISGAVGIKYKGCKVFASNHHLLFTHFAESPPLMSSLETIYIKHPTVSLVDSKLHDYYRWMVDFLPRLILAAKHLLSKPGGEDIHILVPSSVAVASKWISQSFGIPKDRILIYNHLHRQRLHFETLYTIDWWIPEDDPYKTLSDDVWSDVYSSKMGLWETREWALQKQATTLSLPEPPLLQPSAENPDFLVIFVKSLRAHDLHVRDYLKKIVSKYLGEDHFREHNNDNAIYDTVHEFSHAEIVVGQYSPNLVNIIFARPNATVLYIPSNPNLDRHFAHLASALEVNLYVATELALCQFAKNPSPMSDHQDRVLEKAVFDVLRENKNTASSLLEELPELEPLPKVELPEDLYRSDPSNEPSKEVNNENAQILLDSLEAPFGDGKDKPMHDELHELAEKKKKKTIPKRRKKIGGKDKDDGKKGKKKKDKTPADKDKETDEADIAKDKMMRKSIEVFTSFAYSVIKPSLDKLRKAELSEGNMHRCFSLAGQAISERCGTFYANLAGGLLEAPSKYFKIDDIEKFLKPNPNPDYSHCNSCEPESGSFAPDLLVGIEDFSLSELYTMFYRWNGGLTAGRFDDIREIPIKVAGTQGILTKCEIIGTHSYLLFAPEGVGFDEDSVVIIDFAYIQMLVIQDWLSEVEHQKLIEDGTFEDLPPIFVGKPDQLLKHLKRGELRSKMKALFANSTTSGQLEWKDFDMHDKKRRSFYSRKGRAKICGAEKEIEQKPRPASSGKIGKNYALGL